MKEMQEIHEELYQALQQYRTEFDKNLRYTYRRSNVGGYLEKGYWFLGDENKLIVSFWTGLNRNTKLPFIYLSIDLDGTIKLELDPGEENPLKDKIIQTILPLFDFQNPLFTKNHYYIELGQNFEISNTIGIFITQQKPILDGEISQFNISIFGKDTLFNDRIDSLSKERFKEEEKKASRYREFFLESKEYEKSNFSRKNKPYRILSFKIESFLKINSIELDNIPFENRWIFLVGDNGSGKTMILKALSLVLSNNLIPHRFLRNNENPQFSIKFHSANGEVGYQRMGNNYDSKLARTPFVRGFAAYGMFRHEVKNIWEKRNIDPLSKKGLVESILSSDRIVSMLNFNKILNLWAKNKKKYETFQSRKYFLANTLVEIVPGLLDIHFEKEDKSLNGEYFLQSDQGTIGLHYDQLSSGTRSILSLVADIFIRFYDQQPEIIDPSEFKGTVIIDEIDLHLHPQAQKDLVINLNRVFPNIQFIVSTHSPIPLLGAPENSVFLKVENSFNTGVTVERWDTKIPIRKLLPNAILTSPIFDLDNVAPTNVELKNIRTEDNFEEAFFNYMLQKKVDEMKEQDLI